ncbi:hypothetical protein Asera_58070 [Actinocatenispora sera]|uniref:Uncharacterized protein n=1 Tax=Actinocatenispora sera TaxID=390989 RepID=A0A810L8Z1_9ACTN|nr:hypothetical protein Asera_58070 [Actinocatenispora sera]
MSYWLDARGWTTQLYPHDAPAQTGPAKEPSARPGWAIVAPHRSVAVPDGVRRSFRVALRPFRLDRAAPYGNPHKPPRQPIGTACRVARPLAIGYQRTTPCNQSRLLIADT